MQEFNKLVKERILIGNGTIKNVSLEAIIELYHELGGERMLYVPYELGKPFITVIFIPAPGFQIFVESEHCTKYRPNINAINYN